MLYAFFSALLTSFKDVLGKRRLTEFDEYQVVWVMFASGAILLLPLLFVVEVPWEALGSKTFLFSLFAGGMLNVVANLLYMRALKVSDLSLSVPFVTLTPAFLLVTSPIMTGEVPGMLGMIGVGLITIGAYTMHIAKFREGFLAPFRAIAREKGSRLMFLVAFIWSITSNIDKIGVQASSPLLWLFAINVFMTAAMMPVVLCRTPLGSRMNIRSVVRLVPVGACEIASGLFQMVALTVLPVAYVIAIKRTSVLWSSLFGVLWFAEKEWRARVPGALIMFLGAVLIVLFR